MNGGVVGIPTSYAGTNFRSRLEARWAAAFDLLDWKWTYEPFDLAGYIPDFLIESRQVESEPMLVEIKPAVTEADYRSHLPALTDAAEQWRTGRVVLLGATPLPPLVNNDGSEYPPAGLVVVWTGEASHYVGDPRLDGLGGTRVVGMYDDILNWNQCQGCGEAGVREDLMSFGTTPCGHYEGDDLQGPAPRLLESIWRAAGNAVQWRAVNPR